MFHSVKGLLEIYECTECLLIIVLTGPEQITQGEDVVYAGSVWPETILPILQDVIFLQKSSHPASHKSHIHFSDIR